MLIAFYRLPTLAAASLPTIQFMILFLLPRQTVCIFDQTAAAMVPAVIAFGDSIVDTGNNNAVETILRCNFPPYGEDFTGHQATGRFSNGKICSDFIASKIGVKELLPAYLSVELPPEDLLTGVSFASGGSGFDPLTSKIASVLSLADQLELFMEYKERVRGIAGQDRASRIITESLYIVCAGSNDLVNNYFSYPNLGRMTYDFPGYANFLISSASSFIEDLISQGAKRVAVVGMPPIGCVPSQRTLAGGRFRHCAPDHNQVAELYNSGLVEELQRLKAKHQGTKLVYLDIYTLLADMIFHPNNYGFEVSTKGCCGTGELEFSVLCNRMTPVCKDASKYVFWDSFHPTERAYEIIVDLVLKANLQYMI